ncbi:MAG TPA: TIGR03936 family radical SAM-associated protein [Streptosporangiaceae bacterium]|nr:TIGR03936 family radical SAM-associated protein [Streptosporangiaceae bacterium]
MAPPAPPGGDRTPPPVTQRLFVRYAKRNRMRFASHRDIARAVERGVRRAGLPIALSAGFTPHPRISYAGAAPTGTASEAEYLELSLTEPCPAAEVQARLDAALPDGIDVIEVTERSAARDDLQLEASYWQAVLPGVRPDQAAAAVAAFLAVGSAEVERLTSKGVRRMDARAPVASMTAGPDAGSAPGAGNSVLHMVVRHGVPAVRPDDVLAALRKVAALAPASPPVVTRVTQGPLSEVAAGAAGHAPPHRGGTGGSSPRAVPPQGGVGGSSPRANTAAQEQEETTRPGADSMQADPGGTSSPDMPAAAARRSAYDQLPRGAEDPGRGPAPGSLTGDCPHARQRAERQRVQ